MFLLPRINLSRYFILQYRDIAVAIYYIGILTVFYASITPWFCWRIFTVSQFLAFVPIVFAMLLSRGLSKPVFTRKDYLLPMLAYLVLMFITGVLSGKNINGFIGDMFNAMVFLSLFMLDKSELSRLGDMLAKSMGTILCVSIPMYILYLIGFRLPHTHIVNTFAQYSFENYYFFLLDDRSIMQIIPRFHSVFLEPSHLAMVCIALLLTQIGQWKRWYNIAMFTAIAISFSLAGYLFVVIILFGASWMKRRAILGKIMVLVALMSTVVVVSIFYNKGDNLVNNLIVQRLAINNDGKLEGDNRVKDDFSRVYDKFADSEKILVGEGTEKMKTFGWGNAGYKVYLYCNGVISLLFLILFYVLFSLPSTNSRGRILMFVVSIVSFIPHAVPLKFYFFIPLYILTYRELTISHNDKAVQQQ